MTTRLAGVVTSCDEDRVVVAIDGRTASGKTTLADELADLAREAGTHAVVLEERGRAPNLARLAKEIGVRATLEPSGFSKPSGSP